MTTTVIAIYGAVLSTLVLFFNIYKYYSNKGKLKLNCEIENWGKGTIEDEPEEIQILKFRITNIGKKPLMVVGVGIKTKSLLIHFVTENLPIMLRPGEFVEEKNEKIHDVQPNLKFLFAEDSTGKIHKLKAKYLENSFI